MSPTLNVSQYAGVGVPKSVDSVLMDNVHHRPTTTKNIQNLTQDLHAQDLVAHVYSTYRPKLTLEYKT